jgi:hypothetical protein
MSDSTAPPTIYAWTNTRPTLPRDRPRALAQRGVEGTTGPSHRTTLVSRTTPRGTRSHTRPNDPTRGWRAADPQAAEGATTTTVADDPTATTTHCIC